jgi:hypothetical protein
MINDSDEKIFSIRLVNIFFHFNFSFLVIAVVNNFF